jgi:hypothetical protein
MSFHIFFYIDVCSNILSFVNRIRSNFEFNLESNEFVNYKKGLKIVKLSYSLIRPWVETQFPPCNQPSWLPFMFLVQPAPSATPAYSCGACRGPASAQPPPSLFLMAANED